MIISVASGKGGTGKTTVAVNMALSLEDGIQLLDCDVQEPNDHLFFKMNSYEEKRIYSPTPRVNTELCDRCGKCAEVCRFNAIAVLPNKIMIFDQLCHSCGLCSIVCPRKAIIEESREIGVIRMAEQNNIRLVYGVLNLEEPVAGRLIHAVKDEIEEGKDVIIDCPPGTSCPVIESVYGSDFCILVTEPTPFGLHSLRLMADMLREIKIPFGVLVNRAGIGDTRVYEYCRNEDIPILLEIPYDRRIAELYSRGIPFALEMKEWKPRFQELFQNIKVMIEE